jgi:hypothetical protein
MNAAGATFALVLALTAGAVLPATPAPPSVPPREELARSFACPAGTERMGATPPEGFESWCEKPDEPPLRRREGPAFRWYDDGRLAQAGSVLRGERDGRFLEWHRNGKPARAGTYHANERVGIWTTWFESGQREEECAYDHNTRHGAFATWWPDGKRRVEGRFCHDLQCGTWTTWDDQGRELGKMTYEEIRRAP